MKNRVMAEGVSRPTDPFPAVWYGLSDENHFWMKWRLLVWLNAMKKRGIDLERKERVLDVGCGVGTFSRQIESVTSWVVDGLDSNKHAIEMNKGGRGSFRVGDISTIPSSWQNAYDHLFLFDVLEHLDQPKDAFRAVVRVLKPGGLLHINVPALPFLYSAYDKVQGHRQRFTLDRVHSLIRGTPLRVIDVGYWGFSLILFALARKWLVSGKEDEGEIMKQGFSYGGALMNNLMNIPMLLETSVCSRTCVGTSIMVLAENVT